MKRSEALIALRGLSKEDFDSLMSQPEPKKLGLSPAREELLFKLIQGEISVSPSCRPDIEAFALKTLMPDVALSLPKERHPEPPRVSRRLNTLRGLSHEQVEQVLARGA